MAKGSPNSVLHLSIIHWISDNFYLCKGCTIPRSLLYELYVENFNPNSKNRVNSATFGKLVRLVFPYLGTRRLGTRGSTRYHYDGIAIKNSSSFYAHYCLLLSEKKYYSFGHEVCCKSNSQKKKTSKDLDCSPSAIYLKTEQENCQYPWPEFGRFYLWEQELGKKYPYEMVVLLANEYCSYCQDILNMVRKGELDKVEGCITSFWRSLQPEGIMLMSFPDVCQLFKSYDRQLFKEMENILLHDFLEDMPLPYMQSIRVFSKNVEFWLLKALEEFPLSLQASKSEGFNNLMYLLAHSTDIRFLLNSVSSNLQAFVIQPCRSKEEFTKMASDFQLRWNFLLSSVSKAMTLKYADSFGSWHLFNLLLVDFVAHIFLCYIEEVDESFWLAKQNESSVVWVYEPSHLWGHFAEEKPQASTPQPALFYQNRQKYEILEIFLLQTSLELVHCFKVSSIKDDIQVDKKIDSCLLRIWSDEQSKMVRVWDKGRESKRVGIKHEMRSRMS
ncbi:DNA-binding protein RFX8 [Porphyrio hochstetteri]